MTTMTDAAVAAVAKSVRSLTIDAVEAAKSGHPGMPMGLAELGALLYGEVMRHDPAAPEWADRDRFVLSTGHGSMFLYSLLHLAGYDLPLDELKRFRQLGSLTPGHPEYGHTVGVETTTGPLGQGFTNAVGMAIAERMLAARFNTADHTIVDHYVYAIAGDGCLMEGISSEASSLAGHLQLGKMIVFYDSNRISIEGSTELAFTEDVAGRYRAYGWQVLRCDAYDVSAIRAAIAAAKSDANRPSMIILDSIIGKGSPNKAGTHDVHGAPLGPDETVLAKRELGLPEDGRFIVESDAVTFFAQRREELAAARAAWQATFDAWGAANPGLLAQWNETVGGGYRDLLRQIAMPTYAVGDSLATRKASGAALKAAAQMLPHLVGGSADLAPSNNTALPEYGDFFADSPEGRTLHFGVREHAMAAIANGMALHGGLIPFIATFLVFTDYLRPSARLAALMGTHVIYVMTHDSIYVGEDGPTHQPIEHVAAMRLIPGMRVLRPADAEETSEAWLMALEHDGPTIIALTRQNLPVLAKADADWKGGMRRGGYVVVEASDPEVVVVATGSEVSLAVTAAERSGRRVRIVSVSSVELLRENAAVRAALLPAGVPVVSAEAGVTSGWSEFTGDPSRCFGLDRFGVSAPGADAAQHLGLTPEALAAVITAAVG